MRVSMNTWVNRHVRYISLESRIQTDLNPMALLGTAKLRYPVLFDLEPHVPENMPTPRDAARRLVPKPKPKPSSLFSLIMFFNNIKSIVEKKSDGNSGIEAALLLPRIAHSCATVYGINAVNIIPE